MKNKLAKYLFITLGFEILALLCLFVTIFYSIYFLFGSIIFGIFFVIYLVKTFNEKNKLYYKRGKI